MKVIEARNVHDALPLGLALIRKHGVQRESRNGPVLVAPFPVTTVYERPWERVLFWPQRDANPFFHLYESLWMLAGRNDVAPLVRYAKNMANYSDDGFTQHGAYGHRWRRHFTMRGTLTSHKTYDAGYGKDQLEIIANALKKNPDDRRCILQMWDAEIDLGRIGKDVPCNTIASFQRDADGKLELTVFCRSNDIIWGAYGANAVHFSMLQEYMANWIGCPIGKLYQISVNWHAYLDTLNGIDVESLFTFAGHPILGDPYGNMSVHSIKLPNDDSMIQGLLAHVETNFALPWTMDDSFATNAYLMLKAHHQFQTLDAPGKYVKALEILALGDQRCDWIVAGSDWMTRRKIAWDKKYNMAGQVINRTEVNAAGQQYNAHYRPPISHGRDKLED